MRLLYRYLYLYLYLYRYLSARLNCTPSGGMS